MSADRAADLASLAAALLALPPAAAEAALAALDPELRVQVTPLLGTAHPEAMTAPPQAAPAPDADLEPETQTLDGHPVRGLLGAGGMGEVWRVHENGVHRDVALKLMRPEPGTNGDRRYRPSRADLQRHHLRFLEEVQITAQLQHPGIVPVYRAGQLADGRTYYTMPVVRGCTLTAVIDALHGAEVEPADATEKLPELDGRWPLRRVVAAFHEACQAVAYAHSRGVIHRDLKPDNIMVGAFGEVKVMDWGLARRLDRPSPVPSPVALGDEAPIRLARDDDPEDNSRSVEGAITGTLAYCAPEQVRGDARAQVDRRTDVYNLGAVLFHILSGRSPYPSTGQMARALDALQGNRLPLAGRLPVPPALAQVVTRAMQLDPAARHPDANAFAAEIAAWLEGARKRADAMALVDRAHDLRPQVAELHAQARTAMVAAQRRLRALPADAPVDRKRPAWAQATEAERANAAAERAEAVLEQHLRGALLHVPDLVEAHAALVDLYRRRHHTAETTGDSVAAIRLEVALRDHLRALPEGCADRQNVEAYLDGECRLTLTSAPDGAEVWVAAVTVHDRRDTPEALVLMGQTPLVGLRLPHGRYLVELRAPNHRPTRLVVRLTRGLHWSLKRQSNQPLEPLRLLPEGVPGPGEIFIPAGPCVVGGDARAVDAEPRAEVWVDDFIIGRDPVTNGEYLAFLNDLVQQGRELEAMAAAPHVSAVRFAGAAVAAGRNAAEPDYDWDPELPVTMIDLASAQAFAAWRSGREGHPWRIPTGVEWEKAARGTDGRPWPFGEHLDPTWCRMRDSADHRRPLAPVGACADDLSPYGVRGMAGNVRDWTVTAFVSREPESAGAFERPESKGGAAVSGPAGAGISTAASGPVTLRGGAWLDPPDACRAAARVPAEPGFRAPWLGFRLVRSLT